MIFPIWGGKTLKLDGAEEPTVIISFASGDEDASGTMDPVTVESGTEYTLPAAAFSAPAHMTFKEWSVKIGEEEAVTGAPNEKITVTADTAVTAVWKPVQYSVTFVDEDGTVLKAATAYDYGTPAASIARPADPAKASTANYTYSFAGWSPAVAEVTEDATYTATYTAVPLFGQAAFKLPASTKTVGESAFEGLPMTIVEIPNGCESIGKRAFKDCADLTQIRIPVSVTAIDETAFDGCANVLVFGTAGSAAQTFCGTHSSCTFVAEN